jgi:hypothetical protein
METTLTQAKRVKIVKGATQVSGHSLKLHFCVFDLKDHKRSIIIWILP